MFTLLKCELLTAKESIGDLVLLLLLLHDACCNVRTKRKEARKSCEGIDHEMALQRLEIAKSWRGAFLRSLFNVKKREP